VATKLIDFSSNVMITLRLRAWVHIRKR